MESIITGPDNSDVHSSVRPIIGNVNTRAAFAYVGDTINMENVPFRPLYNSYRTEIPGKNNQ